MIYRFTSAPSRDTLVVWTAKPALKQISAVPGIDCARTIGANQYELCLSPSCDPQQVVRHLSYALGAG